MSIARARRHLIAAYVALHEDELARARHHVDDALKALQDVGPGAPHARLLEAGGWVAFVARDHDRALRCFDAMGQAHPAALARGTSAAIQCAGRLGWSSDVRERLAAALQREPRKLRWHVELARIHTAARSWDAARDALLKAVELEEGNARLWLELAEVSSHSLRTLGGKPAFRTGEVREAVARAFALDPATLPEHDGYHRAAVAALTRVGALEVADKHISAAHRLHPSAIWPHLEMAERSLWVGSDEQAREHRDRAAAWQPEALGVKRIDAALAVRAGHADLATAIEGEGDYRLHIWRAEAHLELARQDAQAYEKAHQELTRASMSADGFLPVAWVLRMLTSIRQDGASAMRPSRYGEVRELMNLVPGATTIATEGPHEQAEGAFEAILTKLEGNRSTTPTYLAGGWLARMGPITGERFASRAALEQIRSVPTEDALRALEDLARRFEGFSLPDAHRGELLVWLGRVDESRNALNQAILIEAETRWAYIGLTVCDLLEGDAKQAYKTSRHGVKTMHDTLGPAVYVHEGEALMRMGRHEEAEQNLNTALEIHPSRMSARLLHILNARQWARAEGRAVDETSAKALIDDVPGIFSDARRSLGLVDDPELDAWLESALRLMRGNRASRLLTYMTDEGALRFVPTRAPGHRQAHDGTTQDLDRAAHALGIDSRTRTSTRQARSPGPAPLPPEAAASSATADSSASAVFDDQARARFVREGFVALRGAISQEQTRAWKARVIAKIRNRPDIFVRPFDESLDYTRFDPEDASTWPGPRVRVSGDLMRPLDAISPSLAQGAVELVGRADIAKLPLSDEVILNLNEDAGQPPPTPDDPVWHIDAPKSAQHMANLDQALLLVVLVDDVHADQGATRVLSGSHRRIAAVIEEHGPVDLVDPTIARQVARLSPEVVALTGAAGDAFLLHPLMLHSGAPNSSGRIRWMANPMLELNAPLEWDGPSPVERACKLGTRM